MAGVVKQMDNEKRLMRLINVLLAKNREIDMLKIKNHLYQALLTPNQIKAADTYAEMLKERREEK